MGKLTAAAGGLDKLYEFDREPVSPDKFQGGSRFAGLFAGEHVAATEFVIGAFFVLHGVKLWELIIGLSVGNALAVLSWTLVCAPIAVQTRLTLYWYLRKIAGPGLNFIYNVANALLYCILAGAMIAVSATAVGIILGIPIPSLSDTLPPSLAWVLLTVTIGLVFTLMAVLGFEKLSRFAQVCSPWIFMVFIAGAVAVLPRLGVHASLSNFFEVAQTKIWNGVAAAGQEPFGVWHILFFAWFCNLAMHIGLSDMALFRYAKRWTYGFYSAFGMYLGHFLAWICSGIMVAAVGREMHPGLMAFEAIGLAGAAGVFIAGWTTANPTLYRAGLALQAVSPNWPRWKITVVTGIITSVLSCFPVFFMKLLDYVAIYGLILMPIGAVVVAEHWIFPRLKIPQYRAEKEGVFINWNMLAVWAGTLVVCFLMPIHLYFRWLPGYFIALFGYTSLQGLRGKSRGKSGRFLACWQSSAFSPAQSLPSCFFWERSAQMSFGSSFWPGRRVDVGMSGRGLGHLSLGNHPDTGDDGRDLSSGKFASHPRLCSLRDFYFDHVGHLHPHLTDPESA
jgi:cytosine permease